MLLYRAMQFYAILYILYLIFTRTAQYVVANVAVGEFQCATSAPRAPRFTVNVLKYKGSQGRLWPFITMTSHLPGPATSDIANTWLRGQTQRQAHVHRVTHRRPTLPRPAQKKYKYSTEPSHNSVQPCHLAKNEEQILCKNPPHMQKPTSLFPLPPPHQAPKTGVTQAKRTKKHAHPGWAAQVQTGSLKPHGGSAPANPDRPSPRYGAG
jgi:hypothetical protein